MINNKIIKVCGLRDGDNIRQIESMGIDWLGFIFYMGSPRCIESIPDYMPEQAKRVGVFVNEGKSEIEIITDRFSLDYIQLHGKESPEYCQNLRMTGRKVIKAFPIKTIRDIETTITYEGCCDYFLFDTKCEQHGGSGCQFDWDILSGYNGHTPFLLSGGISQYSARALKELQYPMLAGFDINSRFEISPGRKDPERIQFFLNELS